MSKIMRFRGLVSFVFVLAFFLVSPTFAQEKGWEKKWETVMAAAKKEGRVVVQGEPDPVVRRVLLPKFTGRFGIRVEFIAGRTSQVVARPHIVPPCHVTVRTNQDQFASIELFDLRIVHIHNLKRHTPGGRSINKACSSDGCVTKPQHHEPVTEHIEGRATVANPCVRRTRPGPGRWNECP